MKGRIMEGVNRYFTTTVGLITSTGKHGSNVMAVEWTLHISYEPMLIAIFIHEGSATYENILETGEFGVNMSSDNQVSLVNIAGTYSGKEIDKLDIKLFKTYPARVIKVPMITGCIINAECVVVKQERIGDHVAVIGEVVDARYDDSLSPLIYHQRQYRSMGRELKSVRKVLNVNKDLFQELKEKSGNAFTIRCIMALVKNSKKETLLIKREEMGNRWSVPWLVVQRGSNHRETLHNYLADIGIKAKINGIKSIERLLLKHINKQLRANFVVYDCSVTGNTNTANVQVNAKWHRKIPNNTLLRSLFIK